MGRKDAAAPASAVAPAQTVPEGFELLTNASVYSRHIGPSYARKEVDGATLIQPTLPHMCNSGGVLHGGYMMSFADSAVTRAAGRRHRHGAEHGVLRRRVPRRRIVHRAAGHPGRGAAPRPQVLAFVRGLLEQDGKPLLSYSATIFLRPKTG